MPTWTAPKLLPLANTNAVGPRWGTASEEILDVGREGRIAVDLVAERGSRDAVPDRQREDVDELFARMPDDMDAEDAVRRLVHDDLGPGRGLRMGAGGYPAVHVGRLDLDLDAALTRLGFGHADAGDGRDGVDTGWDRGIVRPMAWALDDVLAHDPPLISGDRRELWGFL